MAEGARLESVYAGNRIEGSNPSPSAIFQFFSVRSHSNIPYITYVFSHFLSGRVCERSL